MSQEDFEFYQWAKVDTSRHIRYSGLDKRYRDLVIERWRKHVLEDLIVTNIAYGRQAIHSLLWWCGERETFNG